MAVALLDQAYEISVRSREFFEHFREVKLTVDRLRECRRKYKEEVCTLHKDRKVLNRSKDSLQIILAIDRMCIEDLVGQHRAFRELLFTIGN